MAQNDYIFQKLGGGQRGKLLDPWQAKCKNQAPTYLILRFYYYFGFQQDVVFSFLKYFQGI